MDDAWYITRELDKAAPTNPDDVILLKTRAESGGESRWVRIPADRYAAVCAAIVAAATRPPSTKTCRCCTNNQCECEGIDLVCATTDRSGM
jgi:hypothetical protein